MTRAGRLRRPAAALAVVVAVLGLTGCFKASHDVAVRGDGTGSVTLHVEVDKRALAAVVQTFSSLGAGGPLPEPLDPFRPVDRTFPDGTRVRSVDTASRATLDASFDFEGPEDYRRKMLQVNQAVAANPDASLPDDGTIDIQRAGRRMDVALDLGASVTGFGDLDLSALGGLVAPADLPEIVVTLSMPGKILTTNGSARGSTVTWDLLRRDAPTTLRASSTVARPGLPAWALPAAGALVLALLTAALGVVLAQRRRPVAAAVAGGPSPPVPAPGVATFFPPPPSRGAPGGGVPASSPPSAWMAQAAPPAPPTVDLPTEAPAWPPAPTPADTGSAGRPSWPEPGSPTGPPPAPWSGVGGPTGPATVPWPEPGDPAGSPTVPLPVTPPDPPVAGAPEPGWYADPSGEAGARYWDGRQWTPHTS